LAPEEAPPTYEPPRPPDLSEKSVDEQFTEFARWRDTAQLSIVVIGRDARMFLPESLTRLAGDCHEIIYLDTGSTDISMLQAREFGCKVYSSVWRQSFAAARNEALSHATGKWVLSLDTDEVLDRNQLRRLNYVLSQADPETQCFFTILEMVNDRKDIEGEMNFQLRVFPNHYARGLRWKFRCHEQIKPSLEEMGVGDPLMSGVRIKHLGYANAEMVKVKCGRNRELLMMELDEAEERPRFVPWFHLSKCAAALGHFNEALEWVEKTARSEQARAENKSQVIAAYEFWGTIFMRTQQPQHAIRVWAEARDLYPGQATFYADLGMVRRALGDEEEAITLLTQAVDLPMIVGSQASGAVRIRFAAMMNLQEIFERRALFGDQSAEDREKNNRTARMWGRRAEELRGTVSELVPMPAEEGKTPEEE